MAEIREVDAETMADIHSYATTGLTLLGQKIRRPKI